MTNINEVDISEKITTLEIEFSRTTDYWEQREINYQIEELQDELHKGYRENCIAIGEHNKRIVSQSGSDICFNCGCKE